MFCNLFLVLIISLVAARDPILACAYYTSVTRSNIHCMSTEAMKLRDEYEKCEEFKGLDYYRCIYNIYSLPKEQVEFFSKYDIETLRCADCREKSKDTKKKAYFCSEDRLKNFKDESQCLTDSLGYSHDEFKKREECAEKCSVSKGLFKYADCTFKCFKDIAGKVLALNNKDSPPTNGTQTSTPTSAQSTTTKSEAKETGKSSENSSKSDTKPTSTSSSTTSLLYQSNIYSSLLLLLIALL